MGSGKAVDKSRDNGFSVGEHNAASAQIANAWKWAAQVARYADKKIINPTCLSDDLYPR